MHLLQRIHGSMITAAEDAESARAVVDVAHASTDDRDDCWFCAVMLAVPATIACAAVGDLDEARAQLAVAERSTKRWQGTAWQAATREARAHLAVAEGDLAAARRLLRDAADLFARAGQPLDAARCRLADLSPPPAPRRRTDDRRAVAADT
jgi:ATP/maltotriose-dependent transcriptional regulator MalT